MKGFPAPEKGRIIGIGSRWVGRGQGPLNFPDEAWVGERQSSNKKFLTGFIRDLHERQHRDARLQELQSELVHISRLTAMGEMA